MSNGPAPEGFIRQRSADPAVDALAEHFYRENQQKEAQARAAQEGGSGPEGPPGDPSTDSQAAPEPSQPAPPAPEGGEPTPGDPPPEQGDEPAPEPQAAASEQLEIPDEALIDLGGEIGEVPFEELKRGWLRQSDYTRKTQEIADQRRQLEEQAGGLSQQQQERLGRMDALIQAMEMNMAANQPSPQEMDELRRTDPAEWSARNLEIQRHQMLLRTAQQERQMLEQEQIRAQIPAERNALQRVNPAFAKDFDTEYTRLGQWIVSPEGGRLPPEMWDQTVDHRLVDIAHKAMLYDQATRTKAPKVTRTVAKVPRVVRPGVQQDQRDPATEQHDAAMARLQERGDVDSLKDAFLAREKMRQARRRGGVT